jgi:hypothetical protein
MQWSVTDAYRQANDEPVLTLQGDRSRRILQLSAQIGESLMLSAAGSHDPDDNALNYDGRWYAYDEAGTHGKPLPRRESIFKTAFAWGLVFCRCPGSRKLVQGFPDVLQKGVGLSRTSFCGRDLDGGLLCRGVGSLEPLRCRLDHRFDRS